jgi:hypothetical protein
VDHVKLIKPSQHTHNAPKIGPDLADTLTEQGTTLRLDSQAKALGEWLRARSTKAEKVDGG